MFQNETYILSDATKAAHCGVRTQRNDVLGQSNATKTTKRIPWAIECNKTMRSPQRRTHCQEKRNSRAMQQDNAQPSAAHTLPRKRNSWAIECNKTMRSPQRRTHCQENEIPGQSNATRQGAALSGVHITKKTKSLGNRMQQDNAQPSAAHTLPRKRNSRAIECKQDNAQPSAAHTSPRKRNSWAIECNKTMRSPQRRTHYQENEIPGQSNATRQCAALGGAHIAKKSDATKTMRGARQCAALSSAHIAKKSDATKTMRGARPCAALSGAHIAKKTKWLGDRMQQDNAQPSAAHTLSRKRNAWAIECNKTIAQPSAAYTLPRKRNARAVGCYIAKIRNSSDWSIADPVMLVLVPSDSSSPQYVTSKCCSEKMKSLLLLDTSSWKEFLRMICSGAKK